MQSAIIMLIAFLTVFSVFFNINNAIMELNDMNAFVLTHDFYLFNGIKHALTESMNYSCTKIDPESDHNSIIFSSASKEDVFILISDWNKWDFRILRSINKSKASVIITESDTSLVLIRIFNYTLLPKKFDLSDLLERVDAKKAKPKDVVMPCLTQREKDVLLYTANGLSARRMSQSLNIGIKTIYQHQRSVMKKMGIERARSICMLPDHFVKYLCYHT